MKTKKSISKINFEIFWKTALIRLLNFDKYKEILDIYNNKNQYPSLEENENFQKSFNSFFKLRKNLDWRTKYYQLFNKIRESDDDSKKTFNYIINKLKEKNCGFAPSYASKMLHVINPEMPIWDQYVLKYFDLCCSNKDINKAIEIYNELVYKMNYLLKNDNETNCALKEFDNYFERYKDFSDMKKLDFIMWNKREEDTNYKG